MGDAGRAQLHPAGFVAVRITHAHMARIHAAADAFIPAPPEVVYRIIADYHNGHPRILPRPPFGELVVEAGGYGAGTRIRFTMQVGGRTSVGRGVVAEPEPGRVLTETYDQNGAVTAFTVDPEGDGCRVTITTDYEQPGVKGVVERLVVPGAFRKIYVQELALLAQVAAEAEAAV